MKQKLSDFLFFGIIILLFATRFVGNQYDHLRHLHPDERWLVMVVTKLHFFDNLNPDFFAYGSFPLYVLKAVAQTSDRFFTTEFDSYDGLLVMGRSISSLLDIATAFLVFFITKKITKKNSSALLAMAGYTLFFFPIQNSNFFIVDNFVNVLFSASLFLLLRYLEQPRWPRLVSLAVVYGLLLASKITAVILLAPFLLLIFVLPFFQKSLKDNIFTKLKIKMAKLFGLLQTLTIRHKFRFQPNFFLFFKALNGLLLFILITLLTAFIGMPYTVINYQQFIREITAQMTMNSDAYIFPYTLQYAGTTAYIYYLKQILFWGVGPLLSLIALFGLGLSLIELKKLWRTKGFVTTLFQPITIYLLINLFYLLIIGKSAVKFMRYLLPLYPAIAVCVGIGLGTIWTTTKLPSLLRWAALTITFLVAGLWTTAFLSIYSRPHSRELASHWMLQNIPPKSVLAEEHWDDRLPLFAGEQFEYVDLPLYELPDDAAKWQLISQRLKTADYIVMTSNRLYGSLPKLADCSQHKKCYPLTAQYYQKLFKEQLDFVKVAEFSNRPTIFGIQIYDDEADESFTVYDHPKVIIFKRK